MSTTRITREHNAVPYPVDIVEQYRAAGIWRDDTIPQALRRTADRYPDGLALATTTERWTYRELVRRADNVAAGLLRAGLTPGDAVVLQVGNNAHTVASWYGILRAGLLPVCTLTIHRRHEITQITTLTGAVAHLVQADLSNFDLLAFAAEMAEERPQLATLLSIGAPTGQGGVHMEDLELVDLSAAERENLDAIERDTDLAAPAVLQLSGGTTGTPKIIPRLHPEYWYNGLATAEWWGFDSSDRLAFGLPVVHNAAIANALFAAHAVGAALVLDTPKAESLLPLMAELGATWLMSPPGVMPEYLADDRFDAAFQSVRTCVLTAAPVSRRIFDGLQERGVHVSQAFGMTEGLFLFTPFEACDELRATTVGVPVSSFDEVRLLVPDTEEVVAAGEIGELCVRGPYTIRGYLGEPERNRDAFTTDGFYRTGDLAVQREFGEFGREVSYLISGRTKDLINRGGEKINAEEIETLLVQHARVAEVALVAMPDERLGERACVYIAAAPGQEPPTLAELCEFLAALGVAKFKWPERLEVLPVLPRTNIGKIQKVQLRGLLSAPQ